MMESQAADARRVGINGLACTDRGERPPYTIRYAQIGRMDNDFLVRATAIRSLNRSRDRSPAAMTLYVKSLEDTNTPVRLEACKALGHMPTDDAIDPLLKILGRVDEDKDVRIAAADALRHYKNIEVARTLVLMLSDRDFGIAWTAHHSLKALTGKDFSYDEAAWLAYLTGPQKPFG
jgi:HEAT repeat protein